MSDKTLEQLLSEFLGDYGEFSAAPLNEYWFLRFCKFIEAEKKKAVREKLGELEDLKTENNLLKDSKRLWKWFANYKGMCEKIYGCTETGDINFPSYGCQAEEIFLEMEKLAKQTVERETKGGW